MVYDLLPSNVRSLQKRMVRDTHLFDIYWNCIAKISNIMPVGYGGG